MWALKSLNPWKILVPWALISVWRYSAFLLVFLNFVVVYPDNFCCLSWSMISDDTRFKKYNQCVSTLFCQQEGHDTVISSLSSLLSPSTLWWTQWTQWWLWCKWWWSGWRSRWWQIRSGRRSGLGPFWQCSKCNIYWGHHGKTRRKSEASSSLS